MRRPRRPSRPARSERRRPRSDTSSRPGPFRGTWTRRPSLVTAMATWRRFRRSNRPNVVSTRTSPSRPGRFAQSTRRLVIVQPPAPHCFDGRPRGGRRRAGGGAHMNARRSDASRPDTRRPPAARRSRLVVRSRKTWLLPALAGLDDESGAGKRGEDHDDSEGLSLEDAGHQSAPAHSGANGQGHRCKQHQRPGEATQVRLHVGLLRVDEVSPILGSRAVFRDGKIPGFASPPHDGFALDDCAAEDGSPRSGRWPDRPGRTMARRYGANLTWEPGAARHHPTAEGPRTRPRHAWPSRSPRRRRGRGSRRRR